MKKILLAVTAALAITGCSQNEEFEAPSQKAEINFGNYTLFTLILKKFTFMIITFKLFVIFAPNIQIRLDFSNHCNDIK